MDRDRNLEATFARLKEKNLTINRQKDKNVNSTSVPISKFKHLLASHCR